MNPNIIVMTRSSTWIFLALISTVNCKTFLRTAPQMCPIQDGNLLDVQLFVKDDEQCFKLCERYKGCLFYKFYESMDIKPSQCFLFSTCGRHVEEANNDCHLSKENTIDVKPFISTNEQCKKLCQQDRKCGYYRYFPRKISNNIEEGRLTNENFQTKTVESNQVSLVNNKDDENSEFCYLLRSCAKRMIDNVECTLGKNNFLDVKFFVQSLDKCKSHCRETEGCRYYWWYPIGRSDSPLYCYLYQQCAATDTEPEVALIIGGRHPGHYYITNDDHNDLIMRNDVCMVSMAENVNLDRAGSTSEYVNGNVIFCGGRNGKGVHKSCLQYDPKSDQWTNHSIMRQPHDEASSATIGSKTYIIGGIGTKSVEGFDTDSSEQKWVNGPSLPKTRARACAVAIDGSTILVIGGHNNSSEKALATVYSLNIEASKWNKESYPDMIHPRVDHACLFVEFEDTRKGILVSGGLGVDGKVLTSVEFFDLEKRKWSLTSSLKIGRTEHVMSLVYGIPTVIGGLSGKEFLSSIEQFDKSSASSDIPLQRSWRVINHSLTVPRYEMTFASIPVSEINVCDVDIV